ncbi:hypothetical protein tinsulaeT_16330 [Thalassotalea insulae]|uniref:Rof transcriptional antiterminator n=1 Tax=Thalassotalea insulae TaxID=2056778 RepID=A0ABQ6GQQ9_9GAMM|nr:Rho-binding antiterminator [Thalassotalea insulae]GLX78293.1 hypothetical protein tinsulaeT_16330 [Thalassotalea insulae]
MTTNISCDAHDYFEIVCMRRSQIRVTTYSKQGIEGIAWDIKLIDKVEMICIRQRDNTAFIALTDINSLTAFGNQQSQHNFSVTWA